MDRQVITQVVAMLVVLSLALRWVPDPERGDPLGLGDPYEALSLDAMLLAAGPDTDAVRAVLRSLSRPGREQEFFRVHWTNLLRQLNSVKASADENSLVQFKGVVRNDVWPLMALLYPLRHTFGTRESGTSHEDPDLPGTTHVLRANMRAWSEMSPEELAEIQAYREADKAANR